MSYIRITFNITDEEQSNILTAILENDGYEGFEETETELHAYISGKNFKKKELPPLLETFPDLQDLEYSIEILEDQNWNAQWEANFQPVTINNKIYIRSSFHSKKPDIPFEIIIDPKMSFGTGHHQTTQLMMQSMLNESFNGLDVLDFGCGTGILSILAQKMGVNHVTAIDHEEWAYKNLLENIKRNHATSITPIFGNECNIPSTTFDCILANVNKNIIIQIMELLACKVNQHGFILASGLLYSDETIIKKTAEKEGLKITCMKKMDEWICLKMIKK